MLADMKYKARNCKSQFATHSGPSLGGARGAGGSPPWLLVVCKAVAGYATLGLDRVRLALNRTSPSLAFKRTRRVSVVSIRLGRG